MSTSRDGRGATACPPEGKPGTAVPVLLAVVAELALSLLLACVAVGQAAAHDAPGGRPVLRRGQSGDDVRELQRLLRQRGLLSAPATGYFGRATEEALRRFQRQRGLRTDGVAGPATWRALTARPTTGGGRAHGGPANRGTARPAPDPPASGSRRPPAPPGPPIPPPAREDLAAGASAGGEPPRAPTGPRADGGAFVALTFDDGPRPEVTPRIAAALAAAGVKATFFVAGRAAQGQAGLVRSLAAAGHRFECHGYFHADLTRVVPTAMRSEIGRCLETLTRLTGRRPRYLRPPRGSLDAAVLREARRRGLRIAMWDNVLLPDRPFPGGSDLVESVLRVARPGAVLMFHADEPGTAASLPALLAALRRAGYEPVPLDALERR